MHFIESYHVDKSLAKNLNIEKVVACFEEIRRLHLKKEKYFDHGISYQTDEDYPIESGFCDRVFNRLMEKKGVELPNPYSEGTDEHRVWAHDMRRPLILGMWCPPLWKKYHEETNKWFWKREVLALEEISEKLKNYSIDPQKTLREIVYLEEKERAIEEKIKRVKRKIFIISLLVGLFSISSVAFLYLRRIRGA